jgi:hypothetical protein
MYLFIYAMNTRILHLIAVSVPVLNVNLLIMYFSAS